jgi:hypothetical protein
MSFKKKFSQIIFLLVINFEFTKSTKSHRINPSREFVR